MISQSVFVFQKWRRRPIAWLSMLALAWALAGCATLPSAGNREDDLVAATKAEVQEAAWAGVQELMRELEQLDSARFPGSAALAQDLRDAAAAVGAGPERNFDALEVRKTIVENPDYWRAMLEMAPGDSSLAALEVMLTAASGRLEAAADMLEVVRAGPLMDEALDARLARLRRLIDSWRFNSPGVELLSLRGVPPAERWESVRRLEAMYPDSPAVALAVLRMRTDLAKIPLVAEGEDQRMRDKIIAAEPRAVETLEAGQPLWAAIVQASGESGDAAKRIAEMLTPDGNGIINFSAEDLAKLAADLDRIGLSDWALRVLRLEMGARGEDAAADQAVWRQLLPALVGEDAANAIVDDWESGRIAQTTLHGNVPEPAGRPGYPIDPVVGGHYERLRRDAVSALDPEQAPTPAEERAGLASLAINQRILGNFGAAEDALNRYATITRDDLALEQERLSLATARGDVAGAELALASVRQLDRRLRSASISVGLAEIFRGDAKAAALAFERGVKNEAADPKRRAYSALYVFAAGQLAGEDRSAIVREATTFVGEDEWVQRLLAVVRGEVGREQILAEAMEGRHYVATGQRCEALFALAFVPGRTEAERRADLEACVATGMIGYIEYDFALAWLRGQRSEK